jgi:membrane-associated PAP2 superfamily phosphatase
MRTREFLCWWGPLFLAALIQATVLARLDLAVAAHFFNPATDEFPLRWQPTAVFLRETIGKLAWWPLVVFGVGWLARQAGARIPAVITLRACIFLDLTYLLGPLVMANLVLKEHWGRARPEQLAQFGGTEAFTPAWMPSQFGGPSFVSGEVALVAATCAVALLFRGRMRALMALVGLVPTLAMAALRVIQGGHFLSDVLFAMLFTWLAAWLAHSALYRWIPRAVSPGAAAPSAHPGAP